MNKSRLSNDFLYEAPEDRGAGVAEDTSNGNEMENEGAPAWTGPSQEEWEQTREAIKQVTGIVPTVQQMSQVFQQLQESEEDEDDLDIGEYVNRVIGGRLAPIMPIVTTAAQKSGQDRMKELLTGHETKLGSFDHVLAEKVAHAYYNETGDPVKAVEEGAKYAAAYRKQEREAAVAEYKKSLSRSGPADLPIEGGGERTPLKAKTYDEVVERWAGQTEA